MSKLITDPEMIRLREESEVQALLGHPPSWLTRWGVSLVAIGIISLLVIGTYLRYPDVVEAPASIQTSSPPVRLEAEVDGLIEELKVKSGDRVESGALLAVLQSPVSQADVAQLQVVLEKVLPLIRNKNIKNINLPVDLQLVELQAVYSKLNSLFETQQYLVAQNATQRKIVLYQKQIEELTKLDPISEQEIMTLSEKVVITQERLKTYQQARSGAVKVLELQEAELAYLEARRQRDSKAQDHINNRLERQQLQNHIIELEQQKDKEIETGWINLTEATREMQSTLDKWENDHLIKTPVAGQVILSRFWSKNQSVNEGEVVLTIDPSGGNQKIIARAELPLARFGKVEIGDSVLLRLESYPYKEFGVVKGIVKELATLPELISKEGPPIYFAQIALINDQLVATHKNPQPIQFTQEMRATARIITEDRSFLERVMDELFSLFRDS